MAQRKKGTSIQPYLDEDPSSREDGISPEELEDELASITYEPQPSQSLPNFAPDLESAPLIPPQFATRPSASFQGYGSVQPSTSWSTSEGIHPYTMENRPNRRPFHLAPARRISTENDSQLYTRFRYYTRLRGLVCSTDNALVIPDHIIPTDFFIPFIPGQIKDSDGKQNSFVTVIAIWNTMMGTSLLTMPWAFGQAGFVGGFLIMFTMCALCLYTAYRILTLQRTMGMDGEFHEIGYLCRHLWGGSLGKAIEGAAVTFSVVTLLGAQVVYWVLMSNFLFNTGQAIHDAVSFGGGGVPQNSSVLSPEVVCPPNMTTKPPLIDPSSYSQEGSFNMFWKQDLSVPLILIFPFAFLLSISNPKIFTYFNSCGAISVIAMYIFVIVKASSWGFNFTLTDPQDPSYIPLFKGTFMALSGTLSLAYFIHNCVITIMKGNRNPENNVRDLSCAYLLVGLTYIPIGVIFYLTFPLPKFCVVDNFLDNFPPHNVVLAIVRGFLLFQMLTVFPLLTCFVRAQLLTYFLGPGTPHKFSQITAINVFILTVCVLVAIFYPNIGFIIRWIGSIAGLAYIFVLPCVAYMQAMYTKQELTWKQIVPHSIVIALGIANFTSQFFLS